MARNLSPLLPKILRLLRILDIYSLSRAPRRRLVSDMIETIVDQVYGLPMCLSVLLQGLGMTSTKPKRDWVVTFEDPGPSAAICLSIPRVRLYKELEPLCETCLSVLSI